MSVNDELWSLLRISSLVCALCHIYKGSTEHNALQVDRQWNTYVCGYGVGIDATVHDFTSSSAYWMAPEYMRAQSQMTHSHCVFPGGSHPLNVEGRQGYGGFANMSDHLQSLDVYALGLIFNELWIGRTPMKDFFERKYGTLPQTEAAEKYMTMLERGVRYASSHMISHPRFPALSCCCTCSSLHVFIARWNWRSVQGFHFLFDAYYYFRRPEFTAEEPEDLIAVARECWAAASPRPSIGSFFQRILRLSLEMRIDDDVGRTMWIRSFGVEAVRR